MIKALRVFANSKFICFVCGILLALFASYALMALLPQPVYAQGSVLQTITVESTSKAESAEDAAREITASAVAQAAREQAIENLGGDTYAKNKAVVEQRIVKQASRFIPFAKAAEPEKQPDGTWKAKVELKVSLNSLRKMLSDAGLGARTGDSVATVLPLIAITDRTRTVSLRWWLGEEAGAAQKPLVPLEKFLHDKLREALASQKIALVNPPAAATANSLPDVLRTERPSTSELTSIGGFFKAAMIARGDVRIMQNKDVSGAGQVSIKIQVIEAASPDRVVAEVVREFTTDPLAKSLDDGVRAKAQTEFVALAKDLASQVQIAWQRGIVGTNYMRLAVRGNLGPIQIAAFKAQLQRSVREVKDVKERLFDRGEVVFEVDYAGDANQFVSRFKSLQIAGFESRLAQVDSAGLGVTLDVRATGTP